MRAAVYARKSTEQHGISEEARSVVRQAEHARAFAERQGWSVVEIFSDDAVSGAEFAKRPGFMRMLNALPARSFDVLIVSELSRLGREQLEVGYVMKQIAQAGAEVWSYMEGKRIEIESAVDKFMMSAVSFAGEIEREKAAARVKDAMLRKARAGHVTGGRVFGYDNVRINSHTERRINAAEAAVIRRIYELSAEGCGQTRIAKQLNEEGAPAPRAQQGRPAGWASSSVREVLTRPLYRGQIIYGKTRKRNKFGAVESSDRPSSEWLTVEAPALAIISEELAVAADQKFAIRKQKHHGGAGRRTDCESNYLLSGFIRCAECGGGMSVQSRQHGGRRRHFYSCSSNWNKGKRACSNSLAGDMELIDQEVLATLHDDVCRPAVVEEALRLALAELSPEQQARDRSKHETELREARAECSNLAAAIAKGGPLEALVERLAERQALAEALERALAQKAARALTLDRCGLERRLRAKLADWKKLLGRNVSEGRQALRALLIGPIRMQPVREERRRGYQFSATIALDRLLAGVIELPMVVASPSGDGRLWGGSFHRVLSLAA